MAYPIHFPAAALFGEKVAALGVGNDHHVIVYDAQGAFSAPRVWWMFKAMGHTLVSVLNGGMPKWQAEGLPLTDAATVVAPATFTPRSVPDLLADMGQVKQALTTGAAQILDVRSAGRFFGREPESRPGVRSGHMPGAANLHYARLLEPGSKSFKNAAGLQAEFETAGIGADRPVITSCGSGVTACILSLSLYLLGREDWAVYDGSWTEWGGDANTAIEV